jgi:hypothetical protein
MTNKTDINVRLANALGYEDIYTNELNITFGFDKRKAGWPTIHEVNYTDPAIQDKIDTELLDNGSWIDKNHYGEYEIDFGKGGPKTIKNKNKHLAKAIAYCEMIEAMKEAE